MARLWPTKHCIINHSLPDKDLRPRAVALRHAGNKSAWHEAISRCRAHHATAKAHPTDVLFETLVQYFAHGLSTSGVEQAFSKGAWVWGSRRQSASPDREELTLKVALDIPNNDKDTVFRAARRVWAAVLGVHRTRARSRIDKGVKKSASAAASAGTAASAVASEKAFIRKRRRSALQSIAHAVVPAEAAPPTSDRGAGGRSSVPKKEIQEPGGAGPL